MNITHSVGFEPVHAVGTLLSDLTVPWWVTGGWAIDLAVGHATRDHANVNVMMLERDEYALRGLAGVDIQLVADGRPPGPWPAGRRLSAGPAAGVNAGPKGAGVRPVGPDRLLLRGDRLPLPAEVILAGAVGAFWVYKHGARIYARPLADITRCWQGIPFLAPEAQSGDRRKTAAATAAASSPVDTRPGFRPAALSRLSAAIHPDQAGPSTASRNASTSVSAAIALAVGLPAP